MPAESKGGKSELRRAVRRVTPGRGNPTESGTENIPPDFALRVASGRPSGLPAVARRSPQGSGERRRVRVKRCGKSAPRGRQRTWQAKPRTEQDQIGRRSRTARPKPPGRLLEAVSNAGPRGMIARSSFARTTGRQNSSRRSPAAAQAAAGGKSELRRAVRRVTPGRGNPTESGTENTQLTRASRRASNGEKVR
jgi:hypothetical protein